MKKTLISALITSSVALAAIVAVPASAQDYYGRQVYHQQYQGDDDSYDQDAGYQNYRQQREYQRYQQQRRAQYERRYQRSRYQGYYNAREPQGYTDRDDYPQQQNYYQGERCKSGTTGAILGAVAGGLLGREIGRGGQYDRPSTTGLILGAGGGALAGRAIERSGNDCR
ncbi:hypothetical protein GCM10008023_41690 [Sphingomonas glacialis]|uniref:17 kDa surface antigen n=1 Tax=Sphingomonas glacialis TaxID=658225 RepID=A0ABQ3LXM8_9SPHN|nr:hypothetical protein [Sphingomonas glacialis]GHH26732.1 hypothetical protein GCM10008023_41690 [Sphingomonas glacialis]